MLELIVNEQRNGIQMLFTDFFTKEKQFVTAFDLCEARKIGEDLTLLVNEIEKKDE